MEELIADLLRYLSKVSRRISLKIYLPTIIVEELKRCWSKNARQESWSVISVSKLLRFIADMID